VAKEYFPHPREGQLVLAKNVGGFDSTLALYRMSKHNPHMYVILVFRNPVDRAYSAYWYARRMGWENVKSFDEAVWLSPDRHTDPLARRNCAYLERGMYSKHLREVYRWFPKEQALFFLFEDLVEKPIDVCQNIFARLGLAPFAPDVSRIHNPASLARWEVVNRIIFQPSKLRWFKVLLKQVLSPQRKRRFRRLLEEVNRVDFIPPPMSPKTRAELVAFYQSYNDELAAMIGRDLSRWNKCEVDSRERQTFL